VDILTKITAKKKARLEEYKQKNSIESLSQKIEEHGLIRPSFKHALLQEGISIIAEVKKGSPSKGILVKDFKPLEIARSYAEKGASALSVLTEEDHFYGSTEHLKMIAAEIDLPILMKDFIIDPIQIYQAKALGASAILLIAGILEKEEISEFLKVTRSLDMDALVEVHNKDELGKVLHISADIIGINNRNLYHLRIDSI